MVCKYAVVPIHRSNKEIIAKAQAIAYEISKFASVEVDSSAPIGVVYVRHDVLGTGAVLTVDFTTLDNDTFCIRDRDTKKQRRVTVEELSNEQ
jgi:glycyl-tRNA synthetase (class II)